MSSRGARMTVARSRELEVAAAVAREAVLQLHVDHALGLIRLGAGRVAELRMLEVYVRLLELGGPIGAAVANSVLASLGHTELLTDTAMPRAITDPDSAGDADGNDASLLRTLRRRLRGRVHDALRRQVELRVGVAKTALLNTHVTHALGFARRLANSHDIADACALYTRMVQVPAAHAAVLYMLVLDRIAAAESATAPNATAADDADAPLRLRQLAGERR